MSLFGTYTTGRELTDEERKWNRMWDLWAEGEIPAPYAQLMEYDAEVNNGGHSQYFFNTANCGDLDADVRTILPMVPELLRSNLKKGYEAFSAQEDISDDGNDDLFDECDALFYDNEHLLLEILKEYSQNIAL